MATQITDHVSWVGKTDWEIRTFHGNEYTTHHGTSYNAYLIRDEKTVLIDSVWNPYAEEFVEKLKKEIDLNEIDYIVMNHGEPDHSGALPYLMREIPDTPIYCTGNGVKSLRGQYHQDWNFVPVKSGDTLDLGSRQLVFVEARMLHWPDSMFNYLTEDNILFSNDAFGQHYCSEQLFNDLVDPCELEKEAIKYYANILTPFNKLVDKKITELLDMNLPVDMICPSHGVIWRDNPLQIVEAYREWANDYQEDQVTIVYDTMYGNTRLLAEALRDGMKEIDPGLRIKIFRISQADQNDVLTEVFRSKVLLAGSCTINNGILAEMAGFLEELEGLKYKNKKALSFGSSGWSGEATQILDERLQKAGFELLDEGIKVLWTPDTDFLEKTREQGRAIARQLADESATAQ